MERPIDKRSLFLLHTLFSLGYYSIAAAQLDLSPPASVDLEPPPGQIVVVPLNLNNPGAAAIDAFGLQFLYPSGLLDFVETDASGTLTDGWTLSQGQENTDGVVSVGGFDAAGGTTSSGVLINVVFRESGGPGTGVLRLTDFVNDIAGATTTDGFINDTVPVELVFFSADLLQNAVELRWVTASEQNNFGFELEKRDDKTTFHKIGFVGGKGTTVIPQSYVFIDRDPGAGISYYRLKQIDTDGAFEYSEIVQVENRAPGYFVLYKNYPNPFNPETTIGYDLPMSSEVRLSIYNQKGQEIRILHEQEQPPGYHTIVWDGKDESGLDVASGVYVYRISAGRFSRAMKMMMLR